MRKFLFWGLVGTGALLAWLYLEARRSHRRDAEEFDELASDDRVLEEERAIVESRPEFLVLRVDRTDPSKNVVRGFRSFELFLEAHPEIELLVGIDQDPVARKIAAERLAPWKDKVRIASGNFSEIGRLAKEAGATTADGIIFDLGVSSMQFDMSEKGFSFMRDGPLDMRMDPTRELTAAEIVNTWEEREIARVIRDLKDPRVGFATVMDVRTSPDLRHARVYVSVLGEESARRAAIEALEGARGFVRARVGEAVTLKYLPELEFELDRTLERAARIDELLGDLRRPSAEGDEEWRPQNITRKFY